MANLTELGQDLSGFMSAIVPGVNDLVTGIIFPLALIGAAVGLVYAIVTNIGKTTWMKKK